MEKKFAKNPLMHKERLELFSDGVFAIAITLLIIEIKVPNHEMLEKEGGLYAYLFHIWPSFLAYVASFLLIGIYWSNHNHLFTFIIKKTNHYFNLINVLFLMTIAFIPFATAVFSDYVLDEKERNAAVSIYLFALNIPQYSLLILFYYSHKVEGICDGNLSPNFMNKQKKKLLIATLSTSLGLIVSFFFPLVALTVIGSSCLLYFLPPDNPEYIN